MNHSPFGPSSFHRRLACPGSYQAEKDLPNVTSPYAEEGTTAHELAEYCLKHNVNTDEIDGMLNDEKINEEMTECIQEYVNYVRSLGGYQEYEQIVYYDEYIQDGFGTADAIVTVNNDIHIIDLKYGKGVAVDAENNPQGMLYALGALLERSLLQEFEKVIIHIFQPRIGNISVWETTPEYIFKWADEIKDKIQECLIDNPPRIAGESQCRFCKAKPTCHAIATRTENALKQELHDLNARPKPPENLTEEDLKFILNQKKLITDWLNSVESHVKERMLQGHAFEGFKLVAGRSNRKWNDEAKAEKKLNALLGKTKSYTKKLLSVSQAEKALGKDNKKKIENLIVKPKGAPTLVPDTDKREALSFVTSDDF